MKIAVPLLAVMLLMLVVQVPAVQAAAGGVEWTENFDYSDLEEMTSAGWTFAADAQVSVGGGTLTLSGIGQDNFATYGNVTQGIRDWNATVRGRWTEGAGGSLMVRVFSPQADYAWWLDGYYSVYILSVNGVKTIQVPTQPLQLNQWMTLSMAMVGRNISLYGNGALIAQYNATVDFGTVTGVGMNAPWQGTAEYDMFSLVAAPATSWERTYGGTGSDVAYSAVQTADGGFGVLGVTRPVGVGSYDAYLVRLDRSGNEVWSKTYGTSGGEWVYSVCATDDGGFAFVGAWQGAGFDIWMVRVDQDGDELWNRSFGGSGNDAGFGIKQTSDGGFVVTGYLANGSNANVFLLKTGADGTQQWMSTFGGSFADWGKAVIQTTDGGYAISGWTKSFGGVTKAYLVRADSNGKLIWEGSYGGNLETLAYGLCETDDGFLVSGHTNSFGHGGNDLYVAKVSASGTLLWERAYGGAGEEVGSSVAVVGGGLVIGGQATSFEPNFSKIYWISTDESGAPLCQGVYGLNDTPVSGTIALITSDGDYLAIGNTNTYGSGEDDMFVARLGGDASVVVTDPVKGSDIMATAAMPVAAVTVSAGIAGLSILAAGGNQVAMGGGSVGSNRLESIWSDLRRRLRFDVLTDFVIGYTKGLATKQLFKELGKIEPEKGVAKERNPFMAGFSQLELFVIVLTSLGLGLAYMAANHVPWLDLSQVPVYIIVSGLALILHDLAHKYAAWRVGAVTEYQFWGLGTFIMIVTTALFSIVFSLPARTAINDMDKLSTKQKAIIYAAGPLMSVVLFGVFALLIPLGGSLGAIGLVGCSSNLLAAVYGMMPFEPMDGKKVVRYKKVLWALMFIPLLLLYFLMAIYVF